MANYHVIFNVPIKLSRQEEQNIVGLMEPLNKTNKQTSKTNVNAFYRPAGKRYTSVEGVGYDRKILAACFICILHIVRFQMGARERESSCENIN